MSEAAHNPEMKAVEAALAALAPRAERLDRDQVMYRAGQAAARPGWTWPVAASLSLVALALLAGYDLSKPTPQAVERVVYVRVPEPVYASPDAGLSGQQISAESGAYLHLRDRVLSYGVDALPAPSPGAAVPMHIWSVGEGFREMTRREPTGGE
jgi:hypothetical protein